MSKLSAVQDIADESSCSWVLSSSESSCGLFVRDSAVLNSALSSVQDSTKIVWNAVRDNGAKKVYLAVSENAKSHYKCNNLCEKFTKQICRRIRVPFGIERSTIRQVKNLVTLSHQLEGSTYLLYCIISVSRRLASVSHKCHATLGNKKQLLENITKCFFFL